MMNARFPDISLDMNVLDRDGNIVGNITVVRENGITVRRLDTRVVTVTCRDDRGRKAFGLGSGMDCQGRGRP